MHSDLKVLAHTLVAQRLLLWVVQALAAACLGRAVVGGAHVVDEVGPGDRVALHGRVVLREACIIIIISISIAARGLLGQ